MWLLFLESIDSRLCILDIWLKPIKIRSSTDTWIELMFAYTNLIKNLLLGDQSSVVFNRITALRPISWWCHCLNILRTVSLEMQKVYRDCRELGMDSGIDRGNLFEQFI